MNAVAQAVIAKSGDANDRFQHWALEYDLDDIAWLTLDRAGERVNALSRDVLLELDAALDELEARRPAGLVIMSGKSSGFIYGADVREFDALTDPAAVREEIHRVHGIFARIEALSCPVVAAISGYCLGGGLELALACSYRIAQDLENTKIGFPEVQLGIFPGFGGSARSVRRLGGRKAMELMLTARQLRARAAKSVGLVDEVIGRHEELRWAARRAVLQRRRSRRPGFLDRLSNATPIRALLAPVMAKQVARKARREHYPAPYALIDLWKAHGNNTQRMLDGEAEQVAKLIVGRTSVNLRRVFHLMERLKALGKSVEAKSFEPRRVHVVGAGVMGGDIAAWCVYRGFEVSLQDRSLEQIEPALKRAETLFRKRLRKPHLVKSAMARLLPDPQGKGIERADVVIEAIFEDLETKQNLFRTIEPRLKQGAVLATNTSAIPLAEIAAALEHPEQLIGLHFFNPVAQMPLVEVVHDNASSPTQIAKGAAFASRIGKFPLPVKSAPGFLVNRVLAPYLMEALKAHQEGIAKEAIDEAALAFGMPMGPVELADAVGLDVCLMASSTLGANAIASQRDLLQGLVDAGKLGKKSGQGLYRWKDGRAVKDKQAAKGGDLDGLARRLISPMLDECERCLAEHVVEDQDLLDAGVIFGTGFAPFRGGPLHYRKEQT